MRLVDNSKCNITQRMDLIRDCKNPTCEFVPISIMYKFSIYFVILLFDNLIKSNFRYPQEDFGADDNGGDIIYFYFKILKLIFLIIIKIVDVEIKVLANGG